MKFKYRTFLTKNVLLQRLIWIFTQIHYNDVIWYMFLPEHEMLSLRAS